MQFAKITPLLLHKFNSESELLKAIEELSFKFTQNRERISDYLSDPRLTSAYVAFYLTTNMPKFEAVLKWMPELWIEELKNSTFVDLGAGPGTFSIAFREWVGRPVDVIQIESSPLMKEQARLLWKGLYPGEDLKQTLESDIKNKENLFLLFGHSANEMGAEAALKYIRQLNPKHILFIEPGTKEFFPEMLKIRSELIKDGFEILFPCSTSLDCGLKNSQTDWCHQFVHVRHSEEVERITQMARRDRRLLPLTVQAFSRQTFTKHKARIIRVFPETKFSFEWDVCEDNVIKHYQVMKRGLSKESLNNLSSALAGVSIEAEYEKMIENSVRVRVKFLNNHPL